MKHQGLDGKRPRRIITDGLHSYHKAINKEFHTSKKETVYFGFAGIKSKQFNYGLKFNNNLVGGLHGTIRERNKTQRGLEKEDSMFIKKHQLYYNFFRTHYALNNETPAKKLI